MDEIQRNKKKTMKWVENIESMGVVSKKENKSNKLRYTNKIMAFVLK